MIHVWFNLGKASLIPLLTPIKRLILPICFGFPLLAIKKGRAKIKLLVDKSPAIQKWTDCYAVNEVPFIFYLILQVMAENDLPHGNKMELKIKNANQGKIGPYRLFRLNNQTLAKHIKF